MWIGRWPTIPPAKSTATAKSVRRASSTRWPTSSFIANGDGTFRDASEEVGLIEGGKGLAVLSGDIDLDGDLDYYVGNDTTANFLYVNDGSGKL